ncbi:MAG: hypothetical protein WBV55_11105 [Candidatus Sulfotelmatobacter sp.]
MDYKTIELAAKLTEKAMGSEGSSTQWIGNEDKIAKFLKATAIALDELYYVENKQSGR